MLNIYIVTYTILCWYFFKIYIYVFHYIYYFVITGMDMENKEPIVGFRVGAYVHGKTCVAPIDKISNVPQRMKDVVNVSY